MKPYRLSSLLLFLFGAFRTTAHFPPDKSQKISLSAEMIINEGAKGNAGFLADEQGPKDRIPVEKCTTNWSVNVAEGELSWYLPANAVIDLGRDYVITKIYLYDGDGMVGNCRINYGIPFRWTPLLTDPLTNSNVWNVHSVANNRTRYLQISKETDADMREIVIYGYPVGPAPTASKAAAPARIGPVLKNTIGINSHCGDPMDKVEVADFVREYHSWHYHEGGFTRGYPGYPNNATQWNPSTLKSDTVKKAAGVIPDWNPNLKTGVDFDVYYQKMKAAGITVFPCIQGTVPWLNGAPDKHSRHKPVAKPGADPTNPASYAAHADLMFQFAARYGHTKVSDDQLKLAPNQPRKSGLGYLDYYENWNEPDGWWGGRSDYFSPYEYAALSSADYDGHESTMGKNKGIKNADPTAKLVMSGIAIPSVEYLRAMQFWFEHNRKDHKFVFDVLTVHHYCNAGGGQAVMTKGVSPEQDNLRGVMQRVTDFRNRYAPEKEVWMTEFGWDTNPVTKQAAPTPEIQGQWLVRAFLACFAGGMDRVAMFMLRDVRTTGTTQFDNSGLIGATGDPTVKPSWYYVHTLREQLSGFVFYGETATGNEKVTVFKFKNPTTNEGIYAFWCPTSDGTEVPDYSLKLEGSPTTATLVTLRNGQKHGVSQKLSPTAGTVRVAVSERPAFLKVNKMP
ncbi:glycosyl hydrolase [Larkinella rosea]|uniref:Asl1-like glycosyl hydrolase catalytic domain-containing protein n=1 Tax=Larkinella rosea TaxID=2025312 RepID=A0A3P1BDN7_9BACT|nr:glycosyl hydrolase [Larkinella rosea]RRA99164.1 hypothetical protein EHT25_29805 [Larkinella rosea]